MTQRPIDYPPILALAEWLAAGERGALVTLIDIDGKSPRSIGAQMAVRADGVTCGYLTGGCLEAEFTLVSQHVLATGKNELRRYGKGSPYIDLRLPCGSGIDVYFDQALSAGVLAEAANLLRRRQPFELRTDTQTGATSVVAIPDMPADHPHRPVADGVFARVFKPRLRLNIYGAGFSSLQLAHLAAAAGMDVAFFAADTVTLQQAEFMGIPARDLHGSDGAERTTDPWTATMLVFHDHEKEVPLLKEMVDRPGFFLGTIGSRLAAEQRRQALAEAGYAEALIQRIAMSAGLVRRARSASEIAAGVLAQVLDTARQQDLV